MSNETVRRKIADLHPHELQNLLLLDIPEDDLGGVQRDLPANGQSALVEIRPDNTVVSGWHRVVGARRAGLEEIEALVRHDLAEQGELAVERYLVWSHLRWRQPHPLDLARLYERLVERVLGLSRPRQGIYGPRGPMTVIAEWLGSSRRNLGRYLRVLRTPDEVQNAFLGRSLSLDQADRVAGLSRDVQEQIAARIRGGEESAEVVRLYLPSEDGRHKKLRHALRAFARNLSFGLADLKDRADQVDELNASDIAVLEQAGELIGQLLRQVKDPGAGGDHERDETVTQAVRAG